MTPDLIARLREPVDDGTPLTVCHLLDEAADALETLMDHAEALRQHLHFAVNLFEPWAGGTAQIEAMKTQLTAFRAAFPEVNDADPA